MRMTSSMWATAIARPDEHVRPVARLAEQELRPPADHFLAEGDERRQHVLQVHRLGAAAVQRHEVRAEGRLQRREAVELVQDDVGHRLALQFDDDAHAVPVALVADVGDPLHALVAHHLGDLLDHRRLVHLIGNLGDDQRLALLAHRLGGHPPAHHDRAAAGEVGRADAGAAEDDAAGREIGTGHDLHQSLDVDAGIVDHRRRRVDHFAEVMRRDVGRHADGDAAGAVDEKVREARRQNHRLLLRAVVVLAEIDGVLVDVLEQRVRHLGEAHFRVAHGRRRVAVDRAEVPLPVDQRQAEREFLRHAHQRVIDRLVAVRVILAHHVADDERRFAIRLVPVAAALVHGVEDAPVHRLQPVAHVGQSAADDHAHGVIEITPPHLVGDRDRLEFGTLALARLVIAGRRCFVSQNAPKLNQEAAMP